MTRNYTRKTNTVCTECGKTVGMCTQPSVGLARQQPMKVVFHKHNGVKCLGVGHHRDKTGEPV